MTVCESAGLKGSVCACGRSKSEAMYLRERRNIFTIDLSGSDCEHDVRMVSLIGETK